MKPDELTVTLNLFGNLFRELADKDYLSARINYRLGLIGPFLWSAFQAIEKYLKAILLYNGKSTINIRHNLKLALNKIKSIEDIHFQLSKDEIDFIKYLNNHGNNRYLDFPSHTFGYELFKLDMTVWSIRRYCEYYRDCLLLLNNNEISLLELNINKINSHYYNNNPYKFYLYGGFLEKVLDLEKSNKLRKALVWKNFYYGKKKKNSIKNPELLMYTVIPPHYYDRDRYQLVKDFVAFSPSMRRYFEK